MNLNDYARTGLLMCIAAHLNCAGAAPPEKVAQPSQQTSSCPEVVKELAAMQALKKEVAPYLGTQIPAELQLRLVDHVDTMLQLKHACDLRAQSAERK